MSGDVLRKAAALMRERAESAVLASGEAAWVADGLAWNDNRGLVHVVGAGPVNVADAITEEQAEHIASWDPAVALAVADLLSVWVDHDLLLSSGSLSDEKSAVLAVATAYLGATT